MVRLRAVAVLTLAFGLVGLNVRVAKAQGENPRARIDGRCGPEFPAPDGGPAECEYIEPYPTCCMENNHCGWICDDGSSFSLT